MRPQKIAILTDSCADLSPHLVEENHIFVVPLRILCADGEYLDGVNIRGEDVYRRLRAGELPGGSHVRECEICGDQAPKRVPTPS